MTLIYGLNYIKIYYKRQNKTTNKELKETIIMNKTIKVNKNNRNEGVKVK
jgi:hypothetical protein